MSIFKPKTRPKAKGLQGYELRATGDEFGLNGNVHFYFEDSQGSIAGDKRIDHDDLPQDVQDALVALHTAVWGKAQADNPNLDATPKFKRAEVIRIAAEAAAAEKAAEIAAAEAAREAEEAAAEAAAEAARIAAEEAAEPVE